MRMQASTLSFLLGKGWVVKHNFPQRFHVRIKQIEEVLSKWNYNFFFENKFKMKENVQRVVWNMNSKLSILLFLLGQRYSDTWDKYCNEIASNPAFRLIRCWPIQTIATFEACLVFTGGISCLQRGDCLQTR